jgi:diguanylate cyclase (GGDEF)-like protein
MSAGSPSSDDELRRVRWTNPASWKLSSVPRTARLVIVGVDLLAIAGFLASLSTVTFHSEFVTRFLLIAVLNVVHAELAARIERMRAYLDVGAHVDMTSVWTFSAVLVLPAAYAAALVMFLIAFSTWQRRRQRTIVWYRVIYSAAAAILAVLAASVVSSTLTTNLPSLSAGGSSAIAVGAALVVYFVTNSGLILTTIYLAVGPVPLRQLLPDREDFGLEVGTLVLGVLTAETIKVQPWLTPLVLVLMVLLQRSSLVSQLEVAATTDAKTGLLNTAAWQELAQRELARSQREESPCALLLLDLDHFKNVNDTLGHLAGDTALRAISEALKRELRGYDAVARFGGEEFVVFLNDLAIPEAVVVAERTLARIRGLVIAGASADGPAISLTASIGLAAYPEHGTGVTELLEAADRALYGAKRAGRDRIGLPPENAPVNS